MGDLIEDFKPEYLIVFQPALTEDLDCSPIHSIGAERNTILGGSELVAAERRP